MVAHDFKLETYAGDKSDILADLERAIIKPSMSLENALRLCRDITEKRAKSALIAEIHPRMVEAYDLHVMFNGYRPEENADEWEAALDDRVEAIFPDYMGLCSHSWFGVHTIDTRYWIEGEIDKEAASFADEAYKTLTWLEAPRREESKPKTISQILSSVGIVSSDIEEVLVSVRSLTKTERLKNMSNRLDGVLQKIHGAFPGIEWSDYRGWFVGHLDNASDDDDGLAAGGAQALKIGMEDIEPLRLFRESHGAGAAEALFEKVRAAPTERGPELFVPGIDWAALGLAPPPSLPHGGPPTPLPPPPWANTPPPPPPPPTTVPEPLKRHRGLAPPTESNAAIAKVLGLIKNNTAFSDQALAEGVGVARATFNNYVNGKATFIPDSKQRAYLETVIRDTHNAMQVAMQLLGMTARPS